MRVISLLLTPLLAVAGAFAVVRSSQILVGSGFHFRIASTLHVSVTAQRIVPFVAGLVALGLFLLSTMLVVRFARLVPPIRWLIVTLQLAVLIVVVVSLFATSLL